ncbi:MAG: oxidoreductase, partial [Chloroflexi bacterium]|nr:oxidoreductase [Chloroflexota bacterium]
MAGGSIALAVVAWGGGRLLVKQEQAAGAGETLANSNTGTAGSGATVVSTMEAATTRMAATPAAALPAATTVSGARIDVAPGTREELTANKDFYRIDIDLESPALNKNDWMLEIKGLFDKPRSLKYADLLALPAVTQPVTMGCISNPVGGDLISTSNWTGVRLRDLLMSLGIKPEARELTIRSADGFFENVVMQDMLDDRTLLVYGMNGESLAKDHGFPLRIYIPNHYGMKQPKWITSIEAVKDHKQGYWVERGWSEEARPQITAVVDIVAKDQIQDGKAPVGGIAWAGDRGIKKVEVQVDGGPWVEAALRLPPLGPLTWVQWRYDWPVQKGPHTFTVRATDNTGALQIEEAKQPEPEGATGYYTARVTI